MENKSFNLIVKRVGNVLMENGFKRINIKDDRDDMVNAVFSGQNGSIRIILDYTKKKVELYLTPDIDVHDQTPWSLNSSWMFDPEMDGEREAISIANDFVDLLKEGAQKKNNKRKKKKSEDDTNVDSKFFINRLVNVFPDLKQEVEYEKKNYEQFRYVTFVKDKVLTKIKMLFSSADSVKIKRFCKLLSDSYENGDKDVRSIVTIVILNSIDNENVKQKVNPLLSEDLQKTWVAAQKIKNKKIKPEKSKVKKSFMSKLISASEASSNG